MNWTCRVYKYRLWEHEQLHWPKYWIGMDIRYWYNEQWQISQSRKSKWKLDAVSNTKRFAYRQQEILLYFDHKREKTVPCPRNISVWQFGKWSLVPEISALFGCNSVVYCDCVGCFKSICKGNDHQSSFRFYWCVHMLCSNRFSFHIHSWVKALESFYVCNGFRG